MHIKLLGADDAERTSFTTGDGRVITPRPRTTQTINFSQKFSVRTIHQVRRHSPNGLWRSDVSFPPGSKAVPQPLKFFLYILSPIAS